MKRNFKRYPKQKRLGLILPFITILCVVLFNITSIISQDSNGFDWTDIREDIKDSVKAAVYMGISSGVVGHDAHKPQQFDRRHWIMQTATTVELWRLVEYPEGTIKAIAYEGLIRKLQPSQRINVILQCIRDNAYDIDYISGDESWTMSLGQYIIDHVLYVDDRKPPPQFGRNPFGLEKGEIDQIMKIFNQNSLTRN